MLGYRLASVPELYSAAGQEHPRFRRMYPRRLQDIECPYGYGRKIVEQRIVPRGGSRGQMEYQRWSVFTHKIVDRGPVGHVASEPRPV